MVTIAIILWTVLAATVAFWVYATLIEPKHLQVRQITMPVPKLPDKLAGLCIAHLSDLHCSCEAGPWSISRQAVAAAQRQKPDLIVITGDLANGSQNMGCAVEQLKELHARYGVCAVLGNHDWDCTLSNYLFGSPNPPVKLGQWQEALRATSVELLENCHHSFMVKGVTVVVVGTGDPSCGRDDLEAAWQDTGPADLKILLAHSPDAIDLPAAGQADLLLTGHTHGGQCRLPWLGSIWAPVWRLRQRSGGLMRFGKTVVHVSQGIAAGLEARFLCPPEISILTLMPGSVDHLPRTPRLTESIKVTAPSEEVDSYATVE